MLSPGTTIDRYVVQEVLGEGGMAIVYKAQHSTLGTVHALKVLTATSSTLRARTIQEGKLQAHVRHANIVAVTDVLDANGVPGLLMEYIAGPSLEQLLAKTRLSLPEALTIFSGILDGVAHAHDHGLVHRDLKPGNVLLAVDRNEVIPKVTDFGLAKSRAEGGVRRTRTGTTMGTPAYMAPEQIRDASSVDERADIYSLGCILYELVCGVPPYDGSDLMEIFSQIATGTYVPPRQRNSLVPPEVEEAIDRALRSDPKDRTRNCREFRDLLGASTLSRNLSTARGAGALAHELAEKRKVSKTSITQSPTPTWSDSLVADPHAGGGKPSIEVARRPLWKWGLALAIPALALLGTGAIVALGGIGWAVSTSMSEATGEPLQNLPPPPPIEQTPPTPEKDIAPPKPTKEQTPLEEKPTEPKLLEKPPKASPPEPKKEPEVVAPPQVTETHGAFRLDPPVPGAFLRIHGKNYGSGESTPIGTGELWVGDKSYGSFAIREGETTLIGCDLKYRQMCKVK